MQTALPSPQVFFERFVAPGRAVLLKGAARDASPTAFARWRDDAWLAENYGDFVFDVEVGCERERDRERKRGKRREKEL